MIMISREYINLSPYIIIPFHMATLSSPTETIFFGTSLAVPPEQYRTVLRGWYVTTTEYKPFQAHLSYYYPRLHKF